MAKPITQAAYARHRAKLGLPGSTPGAVCRAIDGGRLAKSITADRMIKSAKAADEEWAAATKAEMQPLTGPASAAGTTRTAEPPEAETANGGPPVNELAAARARREAANAELAEIELAAKRGALLEARDVEARLADVFLRCRTRLLGIPARLREQDPSLAAGQLQLVEALIVEALEELATGAGGA